MRETGGGKGARRGRKERAGRGKVPSYVDPLAGGISGLAVRALTAPFDLVKIRLQLTPASCSATTVNTVKSVYKKEGPWAFFKGNVAATYLWVTYAAVQFTLYNKISNVIWTIVTNGVFFSCRSFGSPLAKKCKDVNLRFFWVTY